MKIAFFLLILNLSLAGISCGPKPYDLVLFQNGSIHPDFIEKINSGYEEIRKVEFNSRFIILAAKDKNVPKYKSQMEIIKSGAIEISETQEFSIVNAFTNDTPPPTAYFTTKKMARHLLENNDFKILLYDTTGKFLHESTNVMDGESILSILGRLEKT